MGYYTNFVLVHDGGEDQTPAIKTLLESISGYEFDDELSVYGVKWYDWPNDMTELSRSYPYILFTLEGVGEESPDLWRAYFKRGKYQVCQAKITFDEFDETKLKDHE